MIELKNYRTEYLGKTSGKERYRLDAFIGAVQMREPQGQWRDIKPQLVRDADGWHIEGAPYHAEIKDDGTRLFCPDRNERGTYLRLPAPALFNGLGRSVVQNPTSLDGELLSNQITLPASWGEIHIIFGNTGMHFEILFRETPPSAVFGKDSPRILLDAETAGLDIGELLKAASGIGIPPPRLMAMDGGIAEERRLEWSYKNGQMELGLDFGDMTFPVLLKNTTIDVQVGAGNDDTYRWGSGGWSANSTTAYIGLAYWDDRHVSSRFTGVSIPVGVTIDSAYVNYYVDAAGAGSPQTIIAADDQANPSAPNSYSDFDGRTLTTAGVAWNSALAAGAWRNSPDIKTIIQELVDSYNYSSGRPIQIMHFNIGTSNGAYLGIIRQYDYTGNAYGPKLHIEYTAGGETEKTAMETGAGVDTRYAMTAAMIKTESGGGTDSRQSMSASLARVEAGSGADTRLSLLASLARSDSGTDAEQSLLSSLIFLLSSDAGAGLDAIVTRLAMILKTDSGSGIEGIYGRSLSRGESGSGADARLALLAAIAKGETGSGIEQSLLASFVARLAAETGQGSDTAGLIARLAALESGSGVDAGWLVGLKNILAGDLGTGYEALQALIGTPWAGSDMKLPGRAGQVRIPSKGVSL